MPTPEALIAAAVTARGVPGGLGAREGTETGRILRPAASAEGRAREGVSELAFVGPPPRGENRSVRPIRQTDREKGAWEARGGPLDSHLTAKQTVRSQNGGPSFPTPLSSPTL